MADGRERVSLVYRPSLCLPFPWPTVRQGRSLGQGKGIWKGKTIEETKDQAKTNLNRGKDPGWPGGLFS